MAEVHEDCMWWDVVARGAGVLSSATSSIEAELHALRAGLAFFSSLLAERGSREHKRLAPALGASMKTRRVT